MPKKPPSPERPLKLEERQLILFLLSSCPEGERFMVGIDQYRVIEMDDGGMGSLQFGADRGGRIRRSALAEARYEDADGVPVWIELNLDQHGDLFELDSWKVNFEPLVRIAPVEQVRLLPDSSPGPRFSFPRRS
ncbi:MAG: hypothetical protein AB7E66_11265 [Parvibaculaceae bacterium]